MLYHAAAASPHYACLLRATLAAVPPSVERPWRVVLYQDGVDPSDGLAKCHSRKCCVFYWSFLEFGLRALACEQTWMTVTVVRATVLRKVSGGIVRISSMVLNSFFNQAHHDMQIGGVTVCLNGDNMQANIIAKLGVVLGDEPALKEVLSRTGHAGTKPCVLCINCVNHKPPGGADPLSEFSHFAVSHADPDFSKFIQHSDESMRKSVARVHAQKGLLSQQAFQTLSYVHGWTFSEYKLLLNERIKLDGASVVMFDWAHVYLCDGIADVELGMMMQALHKAHAAATYWELGVYIASWTTPRCFGNLSALFDDAAARNNIRKGMFACTASEFLTLAPMLARYVDAVLKPRGECQLQIASFRAVLWVVELLHNVRRGCVGIETLRAAIKSHFMSFVAAYGVEEARPKHHYSLHLPDMLARHGVLVPCLTNERRHRVVKRYARDRLKLQKWELGTLEEVTAHQLWELQHGFLKQGLLSATAPRPSTAYVIAEMCPMLWPMSAA